MSTSAAAPSHGDLSPLIREPGTPAKRDALTIAEAIQRYLEEQRTRGRRPKTLEWHQTALGFWQAYLREERHLLWCCQLTEREMERWIAFLRTSLSNREIHRSESTIRTYIRSVHAFCQWRVGHGDLPSGEVI